MRGPDLNVLYYDMEWYWLSTERRAITDIQTRLAVFCEAATESSTFDYVDDVCTLHWPARISYVPGRPSRCLFDLRLWVAVTINGINDYLVMGLNENLQFPFLKIWENHTLAETIEFKPDRNVPPALRDVEEVILTPEQAFAVDYWHKNGPHHDVVLSMGDDNPDIPQSEWDDYEVFVLRYGEPLRVFGYTTKDPDPKIYVV